MKVSSLKLMKSSIGLLQMRMKMGGEVVRWSKQQNSLYCSLVK